MSRRKFTKEFKEVALEELARGAPVEDVARGCHVDPAILRRWRNEWRQFGERAFGGYGKSRHVRADPRSRSVVLHLSPDEINAVKTASSAAGSPSLAEFARSRLFDPSGEVPAIQVGELLDELMAVMGKLTRTLAKE